MQTLETYQGGNIYNKYESKNPIERWLMLTFLRSISDLIKPLSHETVLDAGCGEGYVFNYLSSSIDSSFYGMDLYQQVVVKASQMNPENRFLTGSVYSIPLKDQSVDTSICLEILEHLEEPDQALNELLRVTRKHLILSVPWEPFWRIANMARFKYWKSLGNTPGHIQHWSQRSFLKWLTPYAKKIEINRRGLWIIAKLTLI